MKPEHWEYAGIKIEGLSLAGIRTSLSLPQYSIAFDTAQGLPHAVSMNTFLISHGHMDHAAGIPYIISQKAMNSHKIPQFIMPTSMLAPMTEIMKQWSNIEGNQYNFKFHGAEAHQDFPLKANLFVRTFPTLHRIPSLGYSLYRRSHRLRSDLAGLSSDEIAKLRQEGQNPTEEKLELLVSFSGDTQIEFLDQSPEIRNSKILILEATYLDGRKTISSAKQWGHTHLDELISRLDVIQSEKILIIHTSARYSFEEAKEALKKRLPKNELERVHLFPGR